MIEGNPYLTRFKRNGSLSSADIETFESMIGFELPKDYVKFIQYCNGGVGRIGEHGFAQFWRTEEMLELNRAYSVSERVPGLFLFGSDGGNEAFAFDMRSYPISYVKVTYIPMSPDDIIYMANDFASFLEILGNR
jgi:hypothetical protein